MKEEHCIVCGEIIPEGRQICWRCEHLDFEELKQIVLNSIDEAKTPVDLFQIVINKVYEKGKEDGNEAFDTLMQSYRIMNEYVMKNVTSRSD